MNKTHQQNHKCTLAKFTPGGVYIIFAGAKFGKMEVCGVVKCHMIQKHGEFFLKAMNEYGFVKKRLHEVEQYL